MLDTDGLSYHCHGVPESTLVAHHEGEVRQCCCFHALVAELTSQAKDGFV